MVPQPWDWVSDLSALGSIRCRRQHLSLASVKLRSLLLTALNLLPSIATHFEAVIDQANTSRDIYADKGYIDGDREARLKSEGWRMHIQRKGSNDKALSEAQERRNRRIASPRARVEHVFAGLTQLGGKTLRLIGLVRATLHLNWKAATYNLRRYVYLKEAGVVAF